jgi:hypothetical protein
MMDSYKSFYSHLLVETFILYFQYKISRITKGVFYLPTRGFLFTHKGFFIYPQGVFYLPQELHPGFVL